MQRKDILTFSYYSFKTKPIFTGNKGPIRYCIAPTQKEDESWVFVVSTWTIDLAHEYVEDKDKTFAEFEFTPDGLDKVYEYLNSL